MKTILTTVCGMRNYDVRAGQNIFGSGMCGTFIHKYQDNRYYNGSFDSYGFILLYC